MSRKSKLVRILFNDGSTYSGSFTTVDLGGDLLILSAPGKLVSYRVKPLIIGARTIAPGIRRIWSGQI